MGVDILALFVLLVIIVLMLILPWRFHVQMVLIPLERLQAVVIVLEASNVIRLVVPSLNVPLGTILLKVIWIVILVQSAMLVHSKISRKKRFVSREHTASVIRLPVHHVQVATIALVLHLLRNSFVRPGYYCPHTNAPVEISCADGTYSSAGSIHCTDCPAGFMCNFNGSSLISCDDGHYSNEGDMDCHPNVFRWGSIFLLYLSCWSLLS